MNEMKIRIPSCFSDQRKRIWTCRKICL